MKKNNLVFILLLFVNCILYAQTTVYYEDFESTPAVTTDCSPSWSMVDSLSVSPINSYYSGVDQNSSTCFITEAFSTVGNSNVILSFNHICKIEFFDIGLVEVSNDNGQSWVPLTNNEYLGTGAFGAGGNYFSSVTYSAIWNPADNFAVPEVSWWQYEEFDISSLTADALEVKVKFTLSDGNGTGSQGNYGWLIDNIEVVAAFSELIPPTINMIVPVLSGDVTGLGPYTILAEVTDNTGIDTVMLVYSYNGGTNDTLGMFNQSGDLYMADLPEVTMIGDEYCYSIYAVDISPAVNQSYYPSPTTCTQIVSVPIPPEIILGTGSIQNTGTTWPAPYGNWYWGARHQFLILASELQAQNITSTEISKLAFNVISPVDINLYPTYAGLNDFTIQIGHTSTSSFSSLIWEQNLTTVFYESNYMETQGWNEHSFQTPFIWDGVSNIVIETCFQNTSYTNSAIIEMTDYGIPVTQLYNADAAGVCSNPSLFTNYTLRPNITLTIGPPPENAMNIFDVYPNNSSCGFSQNENITITMVNSGTNTQTDLYANYSLNGGAWIQDIISTNLDFGDSLTYTFSTTEDFSTPGNYTLDFYVTILDTIMVYSDTIQHIVENNLAIAPFNEDFETFTSSSIANGWEHDNINGNMGWSLNQGTTLSIGTGPPGDHTTGNGNYFYTEYTLANNIAILNSPCVDISQLVQPTMYFWYHMFGAGMGSLSIEVLDTLGNWVEIWFLQGDQGDEWHKGSCDLAPFSSQQIMKFRVLGQIGSTFTSDMAIDDFSISNPPANDVGITSILTPNEYACGFTNSEIVTIEIMNHGTLSQDSIPVSYSINGSVPISEILISSLSPGSTINYSFSTSADMSIQYETYNISVWVGLIGDQDAFNDTLDDISLINGAITSFPELQNFDSFIIGTGTLDPGSLLYGWTQDPVLVSTTSFGWRVWTGQTTSTATGPPADNTTNCGLYMYTESSYGLLGDEASLITPCIDATSHSNTQMEFYYHMHGATMGNLYIDVFDGVIWHLAIDSIIAQQQIILTDPWLLKQVSLSAYSGSQIKIRFRAVKGSSFTSDIAIDDFIVYDQFVDDVGVTSILLPNEAGAANNTQSVEVVIRNYGSNTVTNFDVLYDDGSGQIIENWTGNLLSGASTNFVFLTPYTIPLGAYNLCVQTAMTNDGYSINDQYCADLFGIETIILDTTYFDDFEGISNWYTDEGECTTLNEWELGTPTTAILSTYSGINAWCIDLDGMYDANSNYDLYTPYFDFSNVTDAEMQFWQYRSHDCADGVRIDFTIDGGGSWNVLGSMSSPNSSNWYNTTIITTGLQGWGCNTTNWVNSSIVLDMLNGQINPVQFRFNFSSDALMSILQGEGFVIDDFMIYLPPPDCLGDIGGTAYLDSCGLCVEGNTGLISFGVDAVVTNPPCFGDDGELMLNASGGIPPYTTNLGSLGNTVTLSEGVYQLIVSDDIGCTYTSNFDIVEPLELDVNISFIWPVLSADVTGGSGGLIYEWYWNNLFFGQTQQSFEPDQNGSYMVVVTDLNGCVDSSNVYSYSGSNISELEFNRLIVYPNPFSNSTTILYNTDQEYSIKVFNIRGDLVKTLDKVVETKTTIHLNTPQGVYFLVVEKEGVIVDRKRIVLIH